VSFIDSEGLKFAYRTFELTALKWQADSLNDAVDYLLQDHLVNAEYQTRCKSNVRGPHLGCNMGYHRAYEKVSGTGRLQTAQLG
jgi:hypothetical protein